MGSYTMYFTLALNFQSSQVPGLEVFPTNPDRAALNIYTSLDSVKSKSKRKLFKLLFSQRLMAQLGGAGTC